MSICTITGMTETFGSATVWPSYWFDDDLEGVALLQALRRFRHADETMRRRLVADLDMNATDLDALRFVIARESSGDPPSPHELSAYLQISTASTSKLLDRMTASSHLVRADHPRDRRSLVLRTTPHAHEVVRARLSRMHEAMAQAARSVPSESRGVIVEFLDTMAAVLADDAEVDAG